MAGTETIASIVDGELERYTQSSIDRERLIQRGVYGRVITALNTPANRGTVSLPGEGDLTSRDLTRTVDETRADEVRAIVRGIVEQAAREAVID